MKYSYFFLNLQSQVDILLCTSANSTGLTVICGTGGCSRVPSVNETGQGAIPKGGKTYSNMQNVPQSKVIISI